MKEIHKQVNRAHRRLFLGKFFSVLSWAVFASLLLAVVGIAIPKIWHLDFLQDTAQWNAWLYSWILGSVFVGLITTAIVTWLQRDTRLSAAVEVDRRFRLKERISSALELSDEDAGTPAGQALINDAQSQASVLEIGDEFKLKPTWNALLPIAPLVVIAILFLIPNAQQKAIAEEAPKFDKKRVEAQIKEFRKKVEEKRKQLDAKGLEDASKDLKALGKKFDKLMSEDIKSPKETLVKLNNIKKELEDRRKKIGDKKAMVENLNKLKNLGKGPAKKLSKALGEGDFDKAAKAIKDIAKQLKDGKMNKEGIKNLAKDLDKMAKAMEEAKERRKQEIEELKNKLEKAKQDGDLEKAAKLQEKLEKKQQQDAQMKKMDDLAKKLQECAECMKQGNDGKPGDTPNGDPQQAKQAMEQLKKAMEDAGKSLDEIAEDMEQLQKMMEEMEALEDLEQSVEDCKDGCQGNMPGKGKDGKPKWKDWAKGSGNGKGLRDREDSDTKNINAQVKSKVGKGETIVAGTADGANITGRSASEVRELVRSSMVKDTDPTENQKLTKKQMEHAKQYFKALREQ